MSDKTNKTKQSKRIYLFALLTGVLTLGLLCIYPQSSVQRCLTTVDVKMQSVDNEVLVKDIVVKEIKKQLSPESLSKSIAAISSKMELSSSLFAADVTEVREKLMTGALNVEAIPDSQSGDIGFSISIKGEGTDDEKEFVHSMAHAIGNSLSPSSKSEIILTQIRQLQRRLKESEDLSTKSRLSVEACFKTYADNQRKLFTKTGPVQVPGSPADNWELKNLTDQRMSAYQEFQSNQSRDFAEKNEVQESLLRRMEYLDQQINRLKEKNVGSERIAEKHNGVEQATFLKSTTTAVQPFEVDKELEKLKADLALVVNKLDLASSHFRESQDAASKLTDLLNEDLASVSVSLPKRVKQSKPNSTHLWLVLAISGTASALVVMRIDKRAFGNYLFNEESIEKTLQMPVIGHVEIPAENPNSNRELRILAKWINGTIKSCEVLLIVAFVAFFVILLNSSEFSFHWLNDPVGLLTNSFQ